jgi:hypothetical protein
MNELIRIEWLARLGFAARGVMYLLIGWIAVRTGSSADGQAALDWLASGGGKLVLGLMALGFAGYAVWRLADAAVDSEGHGSDAKGWAIRSGGLGSGLVHLALALYAFRLAMAGDGGSSGDAAAREGASTAMGMPGGDAILLVAAIVLAATGLYQFVKGVKLRFLRQMDPAVARQPWLAWAGRVGYMARGVTFLAIGWLLLKVWQSGNAGMAGGIEGALDALPRGLFLPVAIGLGLFGLFSLVEARYRRITDPHIIARLTRAAR